MKPNYFKQSNACLTKPKTMTDDQCGELYVHRTEDGQCISMWKAPFWQRIKFCFMAVFG